MNKHYLFPLFPLMFAMGCTEANDLTSSGDGDSTGDDSSSTTVSTTDAPATTASTSTTSTDDESSTGTVDGSSTGDDIACTGQCVAAPRGWNGPVVVGYATEGDASCEDDVYANAAVTGNIGLEAPDFTCGCSCSVSEEGACDPFSSLLLHEDADCGDAPQTIGLDLGCNNITDQDLGYFRWSIGASGGACEAAPSVVEQPLQYAESHVACATNVVAEGVCGGEDACVATPTSDAPLCWWQEGDVDCPAELTGGRQVIYTEPAIDTRGCSSCECGEPEVTCDAPGVVVVQENNSCSIVNPNPAPIGVAPGDCDTIGNARSVIWDVPGEPDTACAATAPSEPTGSAEPQGPVTVCCAG
jgi:hypothetical protein